MAKDKSDQAQESSIEVLKRKLQTLEMENKALKETNSALQSRLSQEKNYQKKLALSEDKYRGIIESIQEGYFETDLEGRITFCNQALLDISGYAREDIIGARLLSATGKGQRWCVADGDRARCTLARRRGATEPRPDYALDSTLF